jgi:hypothetical protein
MNKIGIFPTWLFWTLNIISNAIGLFAFWCLSEWWGWSNFGGHGIALSTIGFLAAPMGIYSTWITWQKFREWRIKKRAA